MSTEEADVPYIPPGYFFVQQFGTQPGEGADWMITMGFVAAGIPTSAQFQTLSEEAAEALAPALCIDWDVTGGRVYFEVAGVLQKREATFSVENGRFASPMPPNVAVLARKETDAVGRQHQGRMYLPPPFTNDVGASGHMDSGEVDIWQTAVVDWLNTYIADPNFGGPVLLHSEAAHGAPTPITALTIDPQVASQRRRNRP